MNYESILSMNNKQLKKFLMEPTSYFNVMLPKYFTFQPALKRAQRLLKKYQNINNIARIRIAKDENGNYKRKSNGKYKYIHEYSSTVNDLNYTLFLNKNGKYDWRPLTIVHPVVYVDFVNYISHPEVWNVIKKRFRLFESDPRFECYSIPFESSNDRNTYIKTSINHWWRGIEQEALKYSLKYSYCIKTDISNCYGSIYTHTIAWAVENEDYAKHHRKSNNVGNDLDKKIEYMQYGQTNGIPQGSVIFDIIAELVLGYADYKLSLRMKNKKYSSIKFHVIRYRDDYRIFVKSKHDADIIMKCLSDVLEQLNMKFNKSKTAIHHKNMMLALIKPDKLYRIRLLIICKNLSIQKELLQIKLLAIKFPNSGSIGVGLTDCFSKINNEWVKFNEDVIDVYHRKYYYELVEKYGDCNNGDYKQVINIITSIIVNNPKAIFNGIALISQILQLLVTHLKAIDTSSHEIKVIINDEITDVKQSFNSKTHTEYAQLWLQELSLNIIKRCNIKKYTNVNYGLYNKVLDPNNVSLWDSKWMKTGFNESDVINKDIIKSVKLPIPKEMVDIFNNMY